MMLTVTDGIPNDSLQLLLFPPIRMLLLLLPPPFFTSTNTTYTSTNSFSYYSITCLHSQLLPVSPCAPYTRHVPASLLCFIPASYSLSSVHPSFLFVKLFFFPLFFFTFVISYRISSPRAGAALYLSSLIHWYQFWWWLFVSGTRLWSVSCVSLLL